MHSRFGRTLVVSLLALSPAAAQAGPPLLCFPMAIGEAAPSPGDPGTAGTRRAPTRSRAARRGHGGPWPRTQVLVRMETLRRAVIYASQNDGAASSLFDALRARAGTSCWKDDPLRSRPRLAWRRAGGAAHGRGRFLSAGPPEDGYALVRQALAAGGPDPAMAFTASSPRP